MASCNRQNMVSSRCPGLRPDGAGSNDCPYCTTKIRSRARGAAAWPLAAYAQQGNRVRRIGVLMAFDEKDPLAKSEVSAFTQALAGLGWNDGRNVRIELHWAGNIDRIRTLAQELVGLKPEIILTNGTPATVALQRETRTYRAPP